jgi:hypothetical protein
VLTETEQEKELRDYSIHHWMIRGAWEEKGSYYPPSTISSEKEEKKTRKTRREEEGRDTHKFWGGGFEGGLIV